MKDRLLQEEISLADNTTITTTTTMTTSKRPTSQTIVGDASRPWVNT
jgi:pectin methylesterase-like acyl-CoA thioesterase